MNGGFGIAAFGSALGERTSVAAAVADYSDAIDRVMSWGYEYFHRAPDGIGLTDLAIAAGREALARAEMNADQVDVVTLAMSDIAEYLYWDPAATVQAALGAEHAEAMLINQGCAGGVTAFDLVAGKFATHPDYSTALVIGGARVCEAYWNRMGMDTSVYSDGAAAVVLTRDAPRCRWLTTEQISDGRYAGFVRMDVGGAAAPFAAGEDVGQLRVLSPGVRLQAFFGGDINRMFEFVATIRDRNLRVLEAACKRAGLAPSDLARVIGLHDNVKQIAELSRGLGLPLERTNFEHAAALGHVGCADQILSLERHLDAGDLVVGDVVALTSTSSGMHWACTLLRV